jgi:hypothetical protein
MLAAITISLAPMTSHAALVARLDLRSDASAVWDSFLVRVASFEAPAAKVTVVMMIVALLASSFSIRSPATQQATTISASHGKQP